jgi:predicted phosphohydrolase
LHYKPTKKEHTMASIDAIVTDNGRVAIVIEGKWGDVTRAGMSKEEAKDLAVKLMELAK